jgi:hypothetical protein
MRSTYLLNPHYFAAIATELLTLLEQQRKKTARASSAKISASRGRRRRGLQSGIETPVWTALCAAARPLLGRRGEQSRLARELGVPRQRVHEFFKPGGRLPDAERALGVLLWLTQAQTEQKMKTPDAPEAND